VGLLRVTQSPARDDQEGRLSRAKDGLPLLLANLAPFTLGFRAKHALDFRVGKTFRK
jgi:hypothetical protein